MICFIAQVAQVDNVMGTSIHLGVAKVTDLQPGRWSAIKQCVFKLEIPMTHALHNRIQHVPGTSCFAVLDLTLNTKVAMASAGHQDQWYPRVRGQICFRVALILPHCGSSLLLK